jgi:hypothetical protein
MSLRHTVRSFVLVFVAVLIFASPVAPQPIAVSKHTEAPPGEIAAPLTALLAAGGARAQIGETALTFWWVKSAPVAAGAPEWKQVAEGTFIGVVQISANVRDIRGRTIKPGVYTMRYAVQPSDGDHLGVSSYRDFLLLSPAAVDQDPAPNGHDGAINLSKNTIGSSHPSPWMLDPPATDGAVLSTGTNEMGLHYVVFEVPAGSGALRFGLVLIGKVEA